MKDIANWIGSVGFWFLVGTHALLGAQTKQWDMVREAILIAVLRLQIYSIPRNEQTYAPRKR